jgi:GNAT superfamily N-acetyltransferase
MTSATIRAGRFWLLEADCAPPAAEPLARVPARLGELGRETLTPAYAARLAPGRRAFGAWVEGALAAWGWASTTDEHIGELGLWVNLRPGEAYLWDCVTLPEQRGRGLYRALIAHMAAALRAEGYGRVWIGADLSNAPSQRGIAGAGFLPVVDLLLKRVRPDLTLMWLERLPGASEAQAEAARYALCPQRGRGARARAPRR